MPKFAKILAMVLAGFAIGVAAGFALVAMLSSNSHDKSIEMAMTAFFATGPIGAGLGLLWGLARARK